MGAAVTTKAAHTPGPWTIDPVRNEAALACINGKNWWELASVVVRLSGDVVDHPQGVANARLIAAAPDLLAALKSAEDILNDMTPHDSVMDALKEARAAIAKATGAA